MRTKRTSFAITLLLLSVLAAPASAATALPSCASVTDADAVDASPAYLDVAGTAVEVWTEDNGVPGLQKEACVDGDGVARGADAHEGTVSDGPARDAIEEARDLLKLCLHVGMRICIM